MKQREVRSAARRGEARQGQRKEEVKKGWWRVRAKERVAMPPSGDGEPQCRCDAKVRQAATRQERSSGGSKRARGLGHSPLPCTAERTGVIARHWTLPMVTLSTSVGWQTRARLYSSGWSWAESRYADPTRFPSATLCFCACTTGDNVFRRDVIASKFIGFLTA